jgi:hypothetical protein
MTDKDNITNAVISRYIKNTDNLIEQFYRIYYAEEWESLYWDERHSIGLNEHWYGVIWIWNEFWSINDIYTALNFKIPRNTLFDHYEYLLNWHTLNKWEWCINLYSWFRWNRIYSEAEQKYDMEKINKSYEDLKNLIKK